MKEAREWTQISKASRLARLTARQVSYLADHKLIQTRQVPGSFREVFLPDVLRVAEESRIAIKVTDLSEVK